MDKPKNQQDLLRIITEQDTQIRSLKNAMMRMEQKLQKLAMAVERNQGVTRRLNENTHVLTDHVREIEKVLNR